MKMMQLIAAAAAAMLPNFADVATQAPDLGAKHRRSRSRIPFSNTRRAGWGKWGNPIVVNRDTGTRAGVPGSKLARKAAERRLGLYAGSR